jgi:aminopeptidase N
LAQLGDKAIIAEANRYFDGFLKDPKSLSAELRSITRAIVGAEADAKRWSQVLDLATHAQSMVEKQQFYEMLALTKDRALAQQTLQLAKDKNTPVTLRPDILTGVSANFPEQVFDFALQNHDWLMAALDASSSSRFVPGLAERSSQRSMIQKVEDYGKKHIPPSAFRSVRKAQSAIRYAADIREKRIPEVTAWLKTQH